MSAGLGPPPSSAGLAALVSASSSRVAAASAASPPPGSRSTRTSNGANGGASDHASSSSLGAAAAPRRDARSSPNHPVNLRRAARAELDSTYSIKSYIGAANALLEKAQSAEAGNNLEQAFVNYLKSAK
jgi:ubiquitin carboxyl-terminal hydrolase 8